FEMKKLHGTNSLTRVSYDKIETSPRCVNMTNNTDPKKERLMEPERFFATIDKLIKEERYENALYNIDKNLENDPQSSNLLYKKGVTHGYAKEHLKALRCFEKFTKKHPDDADGWYQLSCALSS